MDVPRTNVSDFVMTLASVSGISSFEDDGVWSATSGNKRSQKQEECDEIQRLVAELSMQGAIDSRDGAKIIAAYLSENSDLMDYYLKL